MSEHSKEDRPRFTELSLNCDVYSWLTQVKLHFQAIGLWNLVSRAPNPNDIPISGEDAAVYEKNKAKCK